MDKDIIIGVDAGTSVIKAVGYSLDGKEIESSSVPNKYKILDNGQVTQSLEDTWKNFIKVILDLKIKINNLENRVSVISVTGQGDGTWLIDKSGNSVCDAWLWLDSRSSNITKNLSNLETESYRFNSTGTGIFSGQQSSQICYMDKYYPDILDKSSTAFHCKDWLYFKLTNIKATDPSEACFTFGNFRTKNYDDKVIDSLGIKKRSYLLPEIVDGSKITHKLTNESAQLMGLKAGTPVSLAYIDAVCTYLGSSGLNINKNIGNTIIGTTSGHMIPEEISSISPNQNLKSGYVMVLPINNLALQFQTNMSGTLNIDWLKFLLKDIFKEFNIGYDEKIFINKIDEWINRAKPGQLIYHPYISDAGERGPFINSNAKASIIGLRSKFRFPDLVRSFIEGLCYAAKECYSAMGKTPEEIILTGGASKSKALREIFSSVLDCPVRTINRNEAGASGAGMIGAMSIGLYNNWNNCLDDWVDSYIGKRESCEKDLNIIYEKIYKSYLESRNSMTDTWEHLSN